jgi:nucleoside 2-deoxyribosyltransferase
MQRVIRATLCGSFHKDLKGLENAYYELIRNQCQVLSPHSLDFEDHETLFVRNEIEEDESVFHIEQHHLHSIAQSDMLWLHAPKGYVGMSSAMEIGYAIAKKVPIYSNEEINDQTIGAYVKVCPSVFSALDDIDVI